MIASTVERTTRETSIRVSLARGTGVADVRTPLPFLTHMLETLAHHSGIDVGVEAHGDLKHHVIEDVAIACGTALRDLQSTPIARYGDATVPMDDALVHCAVDLGGRFFYAGRVPSVLYDHWLRSFAEHARMTLHVRVLRGRDRHHIIEATFKALARALRVALAGNEQVVSTKGPVTWGEM